jgi:hypothetical protein
VEVRKELNYVMFKIANLLLLFLLGVSLNNVYSQQLRGVTKDNLIFYEDLQTGKIGSSKTDDTVSIGIRVEKENLTNRLVPLNTEGDTLYSKVYVFDGRKLIVKYCGMALFEGDKFVWADTVAECISSGYDYKPKHNHVVYFVPVFSSDFKYLLFRDDNGPMFVDRSAVIEIDLNTGVRYVVASKCREGVYSLNDRYILLQSRDHGHRFYIYDRAVRRITKKYKHLKELKWVQ